MDEGLNIGPDGFLLGSVCFQASDPPFYLTLLPYAHPRVGLLPGQRGVTVTSHCHASCVLPGQRGAEHVERGAGDFRAEAGGRGAKRDQAGAAANP